MKKNQKLVFISIYCALALVLDYIKSFIPLLNMPSGGSINIALLPIAVASFHMGASDGIVVGFLWWIVSSLLGFNNQFISIPQYVFDYILPSIIIGASSIFYRKKNLFEIEIGIFIMMLIRTICLILSGVIFWSDGAGLYSKTAWIVSITYNLPYSVATLIILLLVTPVVLRSLKKYML